jgi:type IV pilus assembly protein PilX
MKQMRSTPQSQQQGAVLVVALIMLLLITMVSVVSIRTSTMDERMAGNARDRDRALQAADAAVRTCLKQLTVDVPSTFTGTILPPATTGTENWDVDANWEAGNPNSVEISFPNAGLASNPRCMVERLGTGDNFRVTGRAVGGSATSVVIIQATYSSET